MKVREKKDEKKDALETLALTHHNCITMQTENGGWGKVNHAWEDSCLREGYMKENEPAIAYRIGLKGRPRRMLGVRKKKQSQRSEGRGR